MALAFKIFIGIALLAILAWRVPLDEVVAAAGKLTSGAVAASVALYFTAHALNAVKLRVLLPQLSLVQSLRFTMIAVFYGTTLPGQLAGEAVKTFRLARAAGDTVGVGAVVAAATADKIVGMFALLLLTTLGLGLDTTAFGSAAAIGAGGAMALLAILLLILLAAPQGWFGRWGASYGSWRSAILRPAVLLKSLGLGVVFQVVSIAAVAVLGAALGINLSPATWAVVVGLVSTVLLLPVTVAGVGLREGALVAVMGALGQSPSSALALSLSLLAIKILGALVGLAVDLAGRDRA